MNTVQGGVMPEREPNKYTVKEVLDSLYWEVIDEDGDRDGYLTLVSNLNGLTKKILISEIIK